MNICCCSSCWFFLFFELNIKFYALRMGWLNDVFFLSPLSNYVLPWTIFFFVASHLLVWLVNFAEYCTRQRRSLSCLPDSFSRCVNIEHRSLEPIHCIVFFLLFLLPVVSSSELYKTVYFQKSRTLIISAEPNAMAVRFIDGNSFRSQWISRISVYLSKHSA